MYLPGAIDIGVNFHSSQLKPHVSDVLERARQAQLAAVFATGTSLESSKAAAALARAHPGFIFATAGMHPHVADQGSQAVLNEIARLLRLPEVVAVGECGLDYNRDFSSRAGQRQAFEAQLALALSLKKPLFLHCRDAFVDFYPMVRSACEAGARGVVHCFTGDARQAEAFLELGLDIGVTGWVTDTNRGKSVREALPHIPLERLHLETDAPYLGPKNMKKRRPHNEPANVLWVALAVAEIVDAAAEEVVHFTSRASREMFALPTSA
ncbi:Tat-linked quality control protein TatD [compost metagenome]